MNVLSKTDILNAQDQKPETVNVPEWGGAVLVRGMTGVERDQFEVRMLEQRGRDIRPNLEKAMSNARAHLCAQCIVDQNGARVFTDDDIAALGQKNAQALNRVYEVARRLSGLTTADEKELVKGLQADPFADSPTDSPAPSDAPAPNSSTASTASS